MAPPGGPPGGGSTGRARGTACFGGTADGRRWLDGEGTPPAGEGGAGVDHSPGASRACRDYGEGNGRSGPLHPAVVEQARAMLSIWRSAGLRCEDPERGSDGEALEG